ncbi:MAG TPA: hypothetical protein VH164_01290 [Ktedonobacteraceae bacterium]|jgi:hypothetical protein|nr:hypothetical protein [Ktedonobacteraceae bacterium]
MATPKKLSYLDACQVKTQSQADAMLAALVAAAMKEAPHLNVGEARAIQRSNIGYATGYLADRAQQQLVLKLYQTEHPIFGDYEKEVSPEAALQAGMIMAQAMKETNGDMVAAIKAARESL